MNATREDLARWAGTTVDRVEQWESGELGPTANQLAEVADKLLVSMASFYAENVPADEEKPSVSFRKLMGSRHGKPSYELLHQIQRAIARRDDLWSLLEAEEHHPQPFSLTIQLGDVAMAAERIRRWANVEYDTFVPTASTKLHVLNDWIDAIEASGVAVFHVTRVPIDEMRGLAIKDDRMPIILLSPQDNQRARTFTLLHELTHLALGGSDWSDGELSAESITSSSNTVERFCNQVAAELMTPAQSIQMFLDSAFGVTRAAQLQEKHQMKRVANAFCASESMTIIRLQELGFLRRTLANEWLSELREAKPRKDPGGNFYRSNLQRVGRAYTRVVLDAYHSGLVSHATAGEKLNARKQDGIERMRACL